MIRVLIVDDSSFMRRSLTTLLSRSSEIEIIGTAHNGKDAIEKCRELDPDVVTMDIEMPIMDGLSALRQIMKENPLPVIMVSSLSSEGADVTLEALEVGALDYVTKLNSVTLPEIEGFADDLVERIKALARRKAFLRLRHRAQRIADDIGSEIKEARLAGRGALKKEVARLGKRSRSEALSEVGKSSENIPILSTLRSPIKPASYDLVVIGVSTGGPPAVQKVLSALPEDFSVPVLIAQHMPSSFTGAFAARLDSLLKVSVKEAEEEERLKPGWVYVCPGGKHLRVLKGTAIACEVSLEPKDLLYKPSVNVLMETAAEALGAKVLGVMLTGMGSDGLEGARVLKEKGGKLLAQSEASCVVYGMPKAVVDAGLADEILDIDNIGARILQHFKQ